MALEPSGVYGSAAALSGCMKGGRRFPTSRYLPIVRNGTVLVVIRPYAMTSEERILLAILHPLSEKHRGMALVLAVLSDLSLYALRDPTLIRERLLLLRLPRPFERKLSDRTQLSRVRHWVVDWTGLGDNRTKRKN